MELRVVTFDFEHFLLQPMDGGVLPRLQRYHPRAKRKWATERKHWPDVDVARAGGWASLESLKKSYQQADAETMLAVVLAGGQLREVK